MLLGAHESVAGGLPRAFDRADEDTCAAMQIFTKNANRWADPPIDPSVAEAFRRRRGGSAAGRAPLLSHDSYLINLASPKRDVRGRSIDSLVAEVERCTVLGVDRVVLHPGAHVGAGERAGLEAVGEALREVLRRTSDSPVQLLIENTAGQGTYLGGPFEHLGALVRALDASEPRGRCDRVGICFDTCHAFVFGYDLTASRAFTRVWRALTGEVGAERVLALHLNDTQEEAGSHRDRHARVGTGRLGLYPFWRLVNDEGLEGVPAVLETPPEGKDRAFARQLGDLRGLVGALRPR